MSYASPENLTGLVPMMNYVDGVMEGTFFPLLLVSLWMVLFLVWQPKFSVKDAALSASTVVMLAAGFLFVIGTIGTTEISIAVLVLAMSAAAHIWT